MQNSMDVVKAIESRKSIRKFTAEPVSDEMLHAVLKAGLEAPTAQNKRPFHFVVLRDREKLEKLAQQSRYAKMLQQAYCALVVCGDVGVEGMFDFLYQDCAAATQNILLCAHGLGLGAVWCGVVRDSDWENLISETLALPAQIRPIAVVALGHPAETRVVDSRWEDEKVHFETW